MNVKSKKILEKKIFERGKPHLNIGTLGHVDHGKTTLTSAITHYCAMFNKENTALSYEQIDNAPEEKARGITICARVVHYETEKRHYGHVDCPGHADYVKNMITGAQKLDGAILVIAATDGVKEQTKEHLILAEKLNIKHLVVYVNKTDVIADDVVDFLELDIEAELARYNYTNVPIVRGSAVLALKEISQNLPFTEKGGESIKKLMETVDNTIPEPIRDIEKSVKLFIEHIYGISGRGTVVTGIVESGVITPGQTLELLGGDNNKPIKVIAKDLEMFEQKLEKAYAGDNIGMLINLSKEEVTRGQALVTPNTLTAHKTFEVELYVLKTEEGGRAAHFEHGYRPQFFIGTADITGEILLQDPSVYVLPGDVISAKVELLSYVCLELGQTVSMREGKLTVATGKVTKLL